MNKNLRPPLRVLISFTYIVIFTLVDQYDDKRALAFMQYILFLCYKQPVLIYKAKFNNVGKIDEDLMWWP